jgi:hypothetical protein
MLNMRLLLASIVTAGLSVAAGACAGVNSVHDSISHASVNSATSENRPYAGAVGAASISDYLKYDGDRDNDDDRGYRGNKENDDKTLLAKYGHLADLPTTRSVTVMVKSYYAAAAADDGRKACILLDTSLTVGLTQATSQSAQDNTGHACASSMAVFFTRQHQQLVADDVATMTVINVHVTGKVGLAVLGFRTMPEGEIILSREGHAWKINALLDSVMP